MSSSIEDKVKAIDWIRQHKDEASGLTRAQCVDRIKADTGVDIALSSMTRLGKLAGVAFQRKRASYRLNDRFSRDVVLAKSLIELAKAFDLELQYLPELRQIISRLQIAPPSDAEPTP